MTYYELFGHDFIKKLNEVRLDGSKGVYGNKELNHFCVDLIDIVRSLGFDIETSKQIFTNSQLCGSVIKVGKGLDPFRQRFSIAHELGHIIKSKAREVANHNTSCNDLNMSPDDTFANKFAALLLAPLKLIEGSVLNITILNGLNPNRLSKDDVNFIIKEASQRLQVPLDIIELRISVLCIFEVYQEEYKPLHYIKLP